MGGEVSYVAKTAQQALNVTDFFEPGDADYTQAFARAIAEADLHKVNVFIPPGTWDVSEAFGSPSARSCVLFDGASGIEMFGIPGVSIIRLAAGDLGAPTRLSIVQVAGYCARVVLRDFVVDGNGTNVTNVGSQLNGVDVASGTNITVDNVIVHNLIEIPSFNESAGFQVGDRDLSFLSPELGQCNRVVIRNCIAYDVDFGFWLYEEGDNFQFIDCLAFDCRDNGFMCQPRDDGLTSVLFDGIFATKTGSTADERVFAMQPGGVGPPLIRQFVLRNSSFIGSTNFNFSEEYIATNNIFFYEGGASTNTTVEMAGVFTRGLVADNINIGFNESAYRIFFATATQGEHIFFVNNVMFTRRGILVSTEGLKNLTAINNTFISNGSALDDAIQYTHASSSSPTEGGDISILDNYFEGDFSPAINIAPAFSNPAGTIGQVRIVGNEFRVAASVVLSVSSRFYTGGGFYRKIPFISHNNARANPITLNQSFFQLEVLRQLRYKGFITGGNVGGIRGATRYQTADNPTVVALPGNQGDICNDLVINAEVTAPTTATWNLTDGEFLDIKVDGGATQTATFLDGVNVADITAVTQAELKSVVEAATTAIVAASLPQIRSTTAGSAASIQVEATSTATAFGFDNLVHLVGGLWIYEGGAWAKK